MKKRQVVARADVVRIHAKLAEVIYPKSGDEDVVTYHAGWNDERVAEELGVRLQAVASVRRELYGNIKTGRQADEDSKMEGRVALLEKQLDEVRVKYHRLVQMLALNRVADVKHLSLVDMESPVAKAT